jgi:small ubiquitin-related modifier
LERSFAEPVRPARYHLPTRVTGFRNQPTTSPNQIKPGRDSDTMADNPENGSPNQPNDGPAPGGAEHLNIKVTDNNNEVFFKIKRSTKLEKLMSAFCERQGKTLASVRFLFEGQRVQPTDTPDTLEMQDGDTLEVHQEQVGGC